MLLGNRSFRKAAEKAAAAGFEQPDAAAPAERQRYVTIARTSAFPRQMSLFFKLYILRMFGSSADKNRKIQQSRFQFADCFLSNAEVMRRVGVTEVKAENGINRSNGVANPRFIERVSPGATFDVRIVYEIIDKKEIKEDMELLSKAMKLLQLDYLGGHGTRGSGRVSLKDFTLTPYETDVDVAPLEELFKEVDAYELLPVQA